MDRSNMFSANLDHQPLSAPDAPAHPLSPPPSEHAGSVPPPYPMNTSSTANMSSTSFINGLLHDKDALFNEKNQIVSRMFDEKHELLKEKDEAAKLYVDEKAQLAATMHSLSKDHYEQLRAKDVEILKLKEELANKNERIRGLANALQGYLDRDAQEEEEDEEAELQANDVNKIHREPTVDPLDDVGLGRRFSDDRPYEKRKLTLETHTARLGPDVRKEVSRDPEHEKMLKKLAEAKKLNESRPKSATWATRFDSNVGDRAMDELQNGNKQPYNMAAWSTDADPPATQPRRDALAAPELFSSALEQTPLCGSNVGMVASSKAEVITMSSDDGSSDASIPISDTSRVDAIRSIERSPTLSEIIVQAPTTAAGNFEITKELSDDVLSRLSSPPADIAAALMEDNTPANDAYDELITYASKTFPGQVWKPVRSITSDGDFELGRLIDVSSDVSESIQSSLEYYEARRRRLTLPQEPKSNDIKCCGHTWMSGCGSSTSWTACGSKKYACRTCFNRRRACFLWQGNHQWAVLPLPPDTRDPAATHKDAGFYIMAKGFKDKANDFPGVWRESNHDSRNRKRSASAESQ
ncbi:hypothetical protein CLAFUW4_02166 [Fulvia fulva]|uniref:Uncharacterized protein n=1 Tax=Passalora fulva TaxID=5499 RepID=A0A9Q8P4G6_PASFU|nr:uncharacterized protein CLAFUR5_02157 [Fulvia fulva]UJO13050.1 hypothetical protein CLAFUR5_02157 [Fulvia fulva]WPV10014.1 hypothetical protein CLAFUW4_02166 [Fulvia fulva]